MLEYKELNLNPNNEHSNDCSTRAICYCLKLPWETVHKQQEELAEEIGKVYSTEFLFNDGMVVNELLIRYGFEYYKIEPIELINFDTVIKKMGFPENAVFICWSSLGGHVVAVDGNYYIDNVNRGYLEVDSFYVKVL